MKRFLSLALIYTLNIIIFLFAKSAGAAVVFDRISDLKMEKESISFTLSDHQETLHVSRGPAVECLKKAMTTKRTVGIQLNDEGIVTSCKLVSKR